MTSNERCSMRPCAHRPRRGAFPRRPASLQFRCREVFLETDEKRLSTAVRGFRQGGTEARGAAQERAPAQGAAGRRASAIGVRVGHDATLPFFVTGPVTDAGHPWKPSRGGEPCAAPGAGTATSLRTTEGHASDDVVAVDPAVPEGRRDVAHGNRQHPVAGHMCAFSERSWSPAPSTAPEL